MEDLTGLIAVLSTFATPVLIVWIALHYRSKRRQEDSADRSSRLGSQVEFEQMAEKMERRVQALETILDAEVPDWRKRDDR